MSKGITADERQADREVMRPECEQMMTPTQIELYDAKYWRFDLDTRPSLLAFCYDCDIEEGEWFSTLTKEDREIAEDAFGKIVGYNGLHFTYFEELEEGGIVYLPFITLEEAKEIMEKVKETVK